MILFYIVKIDSNRISNMEHTLSTIHTLVVFQILLFYQVTTQLLQLYEFYNLGKTHTFFKLLSMTIDINNKVFETLEILTN